MTEYARTFKVQLLQLSGGVVTIGGLAAGDDLQSLGTKVSRQFQVPRVAIKLMLCGQAFTPQDSFKTLESRGISQGSELTFFRLSLLEATPGARIVVTDAGSDVFNGTYVGVTEEDWTVDPDKKGHVYFQKEGKEGGDHLLVACGIGLGLAFRLVQGKQQIEQHSVLLYRVQRYDMSSYDQLVSIRSKNLVQTWHGTCSNACGRVEGNGARTWRNG